jgi:hypothetical protein
MQPMRHRQFIEHLVGNILDEAMANVGGASKDEPENG